MSSAQSDATPGPGAGVHVRAVGAAAPSLRVRASEVATAWGRTGGRGQSALCAADEDSLTLAWDAADAARRAAGIEPDDIDGLWWGTSRPPFAQGPSHAYLAAALGLRPTSGGLLAAGSPHAGMDALLAAADAVRSGTARRAIVVASDAVRPGPGTAAEAHTGAGAAAVVLDATGGPATLGIRVTRSEPVLDRYRGDDEIETRDVYDGRLFRESVFLPVVGGVARDLAAATPDAAPDAWSLPDPDGRLGRALARTLGADPPASAASRAELGDAGAAAPLLGALGACATPGRVAMVGYGGGRATGVMIDVSSPVAGAGRVDATLTGGRVVGYPEVLRARAQLVAHGETVPMGVPPGSAMFVRGGREMLGALGGRCVDCGTVSTPPSIHPACIACGGHKLEPVALARSGTVHTYVVNQTMPAPFVAPLPLAVVDLDDGARLMVQVVGDGTGLEIDSRVDLVLRVYSHERGAPVYGFKARMLRAGIESEVR